MCWSLIFPKNCQNLYLKNIKTYFQLGILGDAKQQLSLGWVWWKTWVFAQPWISSIPLPSVEIPKSLYVTIFQNLKSFVSFVWWSFWVLVVSCDWLLSQGQWSYSSLNFSTLLAFQFLITACMNFTFTMQLLILWHDDRTNKKPLKLPFQQEIVSK